MADELSKQIALFTDLDDRRDEEELDAVQSVRWVDLKERLERLAPRAEEAPPSSRRRSLRVPSDFAVTFEDARGFERAYLRNISEGGVYVETDRPLAMGSRFRLAIVVKEPLDALDLMVEVVWVNETPSADSGLGRGVGVAFLDLPADKKKTIKAIVHRALAELAAT